MVVEALSSGLDDGRYRSGAFCRRLELFGAQMPTIYALPRGITSRASLTIASLTLAACKDHRLAKPNVTLRAITIRASGAERTIDRLPALAVVLASRVRFRAMDILLAENTYKSDPDVFTRAVTSRKGLRESVWSRDPLDSLHPRRI